MKRLRRYILNTLSVLSLLLMLGTVGLWVESRWSAELRRYLVSETITVSRLTDALEVFWKNKGDEMYSVNWFWPLSVNPAWWFTYRKMSFTGQIELTFPSFNGRAV